MAGCTLVGIVIIWLSISVISSNRIEGPHEYCPFEHFNATCDDNHVILMEKATYGRMRIGRCVTEPLGYLGCQRDVLSIMDSKCTGRRSCKVSVVDSALYETKPCASSDVTWYLEVEYKCVPVIAPDAWASCHRAQRPVNLNSTHYLSSLVTQERNIGSKACPWELTVKEGQKISVSVYLSQIRTLQPNVCFTLGAVTDGGKTTELTACPEDLKAGRFILVFASKTRHVKLEIWSMKHHAPYLLKLDATGCPDIVLPEHSTVTRTKDTLIITCNNSKNTWKLECHKNRWDKESELRNCSSDSSKAGAMKYMFQDGNILPMGILIAVALGVALGIFLGGLLLVIIGSRMKRRHRQRLQQAALVDAPDYDVRVVPQRYPRKSPGSATLSSGMEYTLSRGTDFTNTVDSERSYASRMLPGCPRDNERRCTSPYHAYETPSMS